MPDLPPEMMMRDRQADPNFDDSEVLFRRFQPYHLDGAEVAPEAFELPDMSVIREKYGRAEWLLLDEDVGGWGVGAFHVRDIPNDKQLMHRGVIVFVLRAEHVPHRQNYPHSEVRVHRDNRRICRENANVHLLEPDFHLRWRERLSQSSWVAIPPGGTRA